ncbi:MAG: MBOAT family O-acyltransferase [Bacteroidales bacterium]
MEITSLKFIILTFLAVFIFYLINNKYRNLYLALLSCGFIATYSISILVYILAYTAVNFFLGLKIPDPKYKIKLFRVGVIFNLLQLVLLKYSSFAVDPIFKLFGLNVHVSALSEILIPVGISYFTLQGIGYLVNVKMGWEKPEKNFPEFLLYFTFFPKFLSGPVERSTHFLPQLKTTKVFNEHQVTDGIRIVLIGLFKKIAIANPLAPFILSAYTNLNSTDGYSFWILFILQPIYLYFDFSGYTDIAIGISRTFGIDLLPNFNRPFLSENVSTFWKRFHMSLSSWFNDYVFRQTSFKYRKWGVYASTYAVFLTWILFGIWHGAGWNFMVLGLLQALAINYEFFTKKFRIKLFAKVPDSLRIWTGRILTYLFYCVALVFFFSPDLKSAFAYFSRLDEFSGVSLSLLGPLSMTPFPVIIYIAVFLMMELLQNDHLNTYNKLEKIWTSERKKSIIFRWVVYSIGITLIFIASNQMHQFVYVNF